MKSILPSGYSRRIGVQNGDVHITADLITSLFRASTRGAAYRYNWFLDALFDLIGFVRFSVNCPSHCLLTLYIDWNTHLASVCRQAGPCPSRRTPTTSDRTWVLLVIIDYTKCFLSCVPFLFELLFNYFYHSISFFS